MGSFTAQLIIGHPHPNHGGINPDKLIYLSEGSILPPGSRMPGCCKTEKRGRTIGHYVWPLAFTQASQTEASN